MAGETTPLLAPPGNKGAGIPSGQLALLCYARWIDGWFFFTIFPYIAQMISDTGVPAGDVGYYSGLIESSYSLVECITLLFFWTDVSDRWGRRPVMIICLAGLAISGTLFGFSTHIWQMIACRALSGAFSGCVGAMRVMLSELSTQETEARMLSIWASADSLGILLAPIAGGLLARPVDQYAFFKGWALFEGYPYLLPSLLMGALGGSCTILCFFGLKETLATKEIQTQDTEGAITYISLLKLSSVPYVLCNSLNLQALVFAWIAVEPIFCYTDVERGGLGFSIRQISLVLACTATTSTLVLLLLFPYCERKFRIRGCLYITAIASIAAGLLPAFANLARRRLPADGATFWIFLAGSLLAASSQSAFGRSGTQLMVNNMAPTSASLGKLNSLTLALNMAGRTLSPAAASALYAFGVGHGILKGQLAWAVLTVCSIGYAVSLAWYPKQADSRHRRMDEQEKSTQREAQGLLSSSKSGQ